MIRKLVLLTTIFTAGLLLSSCGDDTPRNCAPGFEEQDGECVEIEVCYAPQDYPETLTYELVWSDEFDGTELDTTKWRYEINALGGGNNELQYYTDQNTSVADGILTITARKEEYLGRDYTSSRITTENQGEWTYGIFEARIKLPPGRGTWPAFWMMPSFSRYGGWPDSGEIDIMEHVGYDENVIHGSIHTRIYNHKDGSQKGGTYRDLTDATSEFHVYKVEWLPDRLDYYVNDELYYSYEPNKFSSCPSFNVWPFNGDFFLILNIAIGGDWGGAQGVDDDIFPTSMEIDYVRVYQASELDGYDDNTE
jgi:beta-glucanase (GH16 family)